VNLSNDIKRMLAVIQRRMSLMVGRAILSAVDNSKSTQFVKVTALHGETLDEIERFQEYGFETYPLEGAEGFMVFMNGNRDRGVALCFMDRQYRPDYLSEGEVVNYTDEDKETDGHRAHFKRGQLLEIKNKELIIHSKDKVEVNTKDATINCTGKATISATTGADIDGGLGNLTGAVCGKSVCHFTGSPHADVSTDVKVSKA